PSTESEPGQHADDIHRIIQEVGGPVDMFASSGGAVNALALVATHPDDVRILVAHEPPLAAILPDAENAKSAVRAVRDSYQKGGFGTGMAHFIAITGQTGEFPDDIAQQPAPDPAQFGMPADDNGDRTDVLLYQNIINTTHYQPDLDTLRFPGPALETCSRPARGSRRSAAKRTRTGRTSSPRPDQTGGHTAPEWARSGSTIRSGSLLARVHARAVISRRIRRARSRYH